ncbi:MAG: YncE family protein [Deltaproteobacteria bacterium]|nr:YncE family protein [Deltaproteobacteria bacterium]
MAIDVQRLEVVRRWSAVMRGGGLQLGIATRDGQVLYLHAGADAPWLLKLALPAMTLSRIFLPGQGSPGAIALSPDERTLYAALDRGVLALVDTRQARVRKVLFFTERETVEEHWSTRHEGPGVPNGALVTPDGRALFVNIETPIEGRNATLWRVDLEREQVAARIDLGKPSGGHGNLAMTPDGRLLYVASLHDSTVWAVDARADRIVQTWTDAVRPHGVFMRPDGQQLWVPNGGRREDGTGRSLWVLDPARRVRLATLPAEDRPHWLDFTPDGRLVVVDAIFSDLITVIDTHTLKEVARVPVGNRAAGRPTPKDRPGAWHPKLSPDGRWVYVAVNYLDAVQVVDLDRRAVVKTIPVGPSPHQVHLFWPGAPYQAGWWTLRFPWVLAQE